MITFNDFLKKYNLKNRATNNIKIYEVLKKTGQDSKVGIYLRVGDFSTNYGVVNLHPSRGTHWVCYTKYCYFDSYGFSPPKNFLNTWKLSIENVFILSIRFKRMKAILQAIVHIYFFKQKS